MRWRELVAVVLLVVLADLTIYRGFGFAGYGALFLGAPLLLVLGAPRFRGGIGLGILGGMFVALSAKMFWCGSGLLVGCGFVLLVGFAMALAGLRPYVLEIFAVGFQVTVAGYQGLKHYRLSTSTERRPVFRGVWHRYGLALAALVAFGLLFIVANPDLSDWCGQSASHVFDSVCQWFTHYGPSWQEIVFWIAVLWVVVGLLRPVMQPPKRRATSATSADDTSSPAVLPPAVLPPAAYFFVPFRNTLIAVIFLFAVYLVFEFATLWFREFPEGFYYSGYAHEGAAWLTVALALATAVLSLIFQGEVLGDARLPGLKRLAWIWSAENMLLAIAVYNRLAIYVGFNGMTRMRTVALFGMTCVVAGFLLVIWKIARRKSFLWLLRYHLWALALATYLFALWPVDAVAHGYNVRRILSGDSAPSVQISVHPIDSEGVLFLLPLTECDDPIVREGVRAMLAERLEEAESIARGRREQGWTTNQCADNLVLTRLRAERSRWAKYTNPEKRRKALNAFHAYAYQWY